MRKLVTAVLVLSGIGVVGLASSGPAMAYDYPWCVQGRGVGSPVTARTKPSNSAGRLHPVAPCLQYQSARCVQALRLVVLCSLSGRVLYDEAGSCGPLLKKAARPASNFLA